MNNRNIYLTHIDSLVESENKYLKWYNSLIERFIARGIPDNNYIEQHHIFPVTFCNGDKTLINDRRNKVKVSAREHFILHYLLTKLNFRNNDNRNKMKYAVTCFSRNKNKRNLNSKQYEIARKLAVELAKGKKLKDSTKEKLSIAHKRKSCFYDNNGNRYYLKTDDPLITELGLIGNRKGMTSVIDKDGNTFSVDKDDPRLKTGELKGIQAGKASYRSSCGKIYTLKIDDPMIKELNLVHINTGRKPSTEVREKYSVRRKGSNNNMYGKTNEVCCFDTVDKQFLRIKKELFDSDNRYVGVNNKLAKEHRKKTKT